MTRSAGIGRRAAAGLAALSVGAGLAVAVAGAAWAAVPDRWGFAFVSNPAVPGIPPPAHQKGSWPAPLKVTTKPGAVGQVFVRFPKLASKGGIVHVTAVSGTPVWCQAQRWARSGSAEVVVVRCYRPGGVPVFSPFTVLYSRSSAGFVPAGRGYGYAYFRPGHGLVARFNSAGAADTVTAAGPGAWKLSMPGLGSAKLSGSVQVTAVNPVKPAKCQLSGWASTPARQVFRISCYGAGTAPMNTGWTLSYQRKRAITGTQPKHFGYAFDNKPLVAGPYAPVPPAVNFNSLGGINTVRRAGGGLRLVDFPRVGVLPNIVLVTGVKAGAGFCNLLSPWATDIATRNVIVRDVACYTAAGKPQAHLATITYTSAG
jgi:hypothetical protein